VKWHRNGIQCWSLLFIYLFIDAWALSTQDIITEQWHNDNANVHSKVPIKVQNIRDIKSGLHPEAKQGLPHLNGSFATCHSDSGTTRLETIRTVLEVLKPQSLSLTMYRCHHCEWGSFIAKILLNLLICCPPKMPSSEVLLKCIALINALKILLEVLKNL